MRAVRSALLLIVVVVGAESQLLADDKRPMPDYDGRPERGTAGDVALWVPRVVFFPLYFVNEFVIRRPLGWVFTEVEEHHVLRASTNPRVYVVPNLYFESGFKPSLGVYVFSHRLFSEDNELHARFGSWGLSSPSVGFVDHFRRGPVTLSANLSWAHRPDYMFFGLGPSSRDDDRARFHAGRFAAALGVAFELAQPVELAVNAGLRDVDFDEGSCCDDPSLAAQIAAGVFPEPHGFGDGVRAFVQRLELTVDSRVPGPWRQSGVRFSAEVEHGSDLKHTDDDWLRYEWPVWVWLHGTLTAEVGNVFGRGLEGFEAERLRMSFSVGIGSPGRNQHFQALIGVGTDPFDEGAGVSWVRVAIGGVSAF